MQPKFYCENCRKEVSVKDKVCPHCGRFFSEIRCPKCGFTGNGDAFRTGCPKCGYLNPALNDRGGGEGDFEYLSPNAFETPKKTEKSGKTLPLWFFLTVTISLAMALAVLIYLFLNL